MESIYILIPVALVFLAVAVGIYFWSVKNGQYDDLDSEASRILFDDQVKAKSKPGVKPQAKPQAENRETESKHD